MLDIREILIEGRLMLRIESLFAMDALHITIDPRDNCTPGTSYTVRAIAHAVKGEGPTQARSSRRMKSAAAASLVVDRIVAVEDHHLIAARRPERCPGCADHVQEPAGGG